MNFTATLNINNSDIFQHRTVPKVANERHCTSIPIYSTNYQNYLDEKESLQKNMNSFESSSVSDFTFQIYFELKI